MRSDSFSNRRGCSEIVCLSAYSRYEGSIADRGDHRVVMRITKPRRFMRLSCMTAGPLVLSWRVKRGTARHVTTQKKHPTAAIATIAV